MNFASYDFIRGGMKFGVLYAVLQGLAMSFVIFLGTVIGDCDPGPGCHDNDAVVIGLGILTAMPIIALFSMILYAGAGCARSFLTDRIGSGVTVWLLGKLTVVSVWVNFDLAMMLHMWLQK